MSPELQTLTILFSCKEATFVFLATVRFSFNVTVEFIAHKHIFAYQHFNEK